MMDFKKIFQLLLKVGISIAILFFLFRSVDEKVIFGLIKNSNKLFLFFAFIVFLVNYLLCFFRWEMLLQAVEIDLPVKKVIASFSGGIFFNLFLPSTVGGDFVRSMDLASHTKKSKEVVATVFLDRLSGFVGMVLVSLFAVSFGFKLVQDKAVFIPVFIITGILAFILLILFNEFLFLKINKLLHSSSAGKIRETVKNIHQEIYYFRRHKPVIFKNLLLSLAIQLIAPATFFLIGLSLGIRINPVYFFVYLPIISAITMLPISIGGLGVRDATTIYFFAKAGVVKDLAFAASLINFFFILICGSLGGIIYVLSLHHRRIQHHKSSPFRPRS